VYFRRGKKKKRGVRITNPRKLLQYGIPEQVRGSAYNSYHSTNFKEEKEVSSGRGEKKKNPFPMEDRTEFTLWVETRVRAERNHAL